jgi:hypothetical protein
MRKFIVVTAALCSLSACATIMHGSNQDVSFSSSPTGATVFVDNQQLGVTPVTVKLSRKDHHMVRLEMAGYQPYETKLTRGVSGWVWGNLVFGGIPGLAIDAMTGGLYKLTPENVEATLVGRTALSPRTDELQIRIVLFPDPQWEKIGQMEPVGQ